MPPTVARISVPSWLDQAIVNGFGFVPRRDGVDGASDQTLIRSIDQILVIAKTQPMKVLTMLPSIIPEASKAVWNDLRLGCGRDAVTLRAMSTNSSDGSRAEAPDGTQAINDLFANLPQEIGSLQNALAQNFLMTQFSGMCAVEAVPGPRNQGVKEVWPIDTLTTRFRRNKDTKQVELWQRVRVWGRPIDKKMYGGFIPLPVERTFWSSLDGFPSDPYGRAPMAASLMPVLEMIGFIKDLLLAWHRVGTPKWDVGFDYEMWAKVAREIIGLSDKAEIKKFVKEQFDETVSNFSDLNADDAFFHDIKSTVTVNGSGGQWPQVEQIYNFLRWRLVIALKQMPTLMGVVEGNTETWSSVDWQIYAKGLETMVWCAAQPLVRAAQLHLQLLGMPYTVEATVSPVRSNQRMVDAQAEEIELRNLITKILAGFITQETASMQSVGSAPVEKMDVKTIGENTGIIQPEPPPGPKPATGTKGPSKGN